METAEGFMTKQVSDLFQIETSYLRQNNNIFIFFHVPAFMFKIYSQFTFTCCFLSIFLNLQAIIAWPLGSQF
jgi:hypothetical protein